MSSSCASSVTTSTVTSTDSCCSSGEQSSVEEEEVEEVVVVENSSDHYSRIERNHYHQRTPAAASSAFGGHNREHQSKQKHKGKRKSHSKQGIRVPVMPLPRSKSFHQILRPTANGHILASNGTIRGAGKGKLVAKSSRDLVLLGDDQQQQQQQPQQQESLQPLANRVKQLFGPKTTTSSSNNNNKSSSKDHSSGEKVSDACVLILSFPFGWSPLIYCALIYDSTDLRSVRQSVFLIWPSLGHHLADDLL